MVTTKYILCLVLQKVLRPSGVSTYLIQKLTQLLNETLSNQYKAFL